MQDSEREGLVSLDEGDFEVAEGEPDIRGWDVITSDRRRIGEVDDLLADPEAMKVRYLTIELDDDVTRGGIGDDVVRVPIAHARLHEAEKKVVLEIDATQLGTLELSPRGAARNDRSEQVSMTRAEEELRVGTRRVQAGEVELRKEVETERVSQPLTLEREEVVVERRPVTEARGSDVQIGANEIRMPVMEEEAVVEKRPVIKEEIVIRKRAIRTEETVEADIQKERVDVERRGNIREHEGTIDRRR